DCRGQLRGRRAGIRRRNPVRRRRLRRAGRNPCRLASAAARRRDGGLQGARTGGGGRSGGATRIRRRRAQVIDVAIVGAGVVGASVAYWLTRLSPSIAVTLIERDTSFARASSALSASSIRQQFSSPVNIRMSLFGAAFLREMKISFNESG